jgi:hypothetical protein
LKYGLARVVFFVACTFVPHLSHAEGMTPHEKPMTNTMTMPQVEDTRPLVNLSPEAINLLRADMRSMLAAFSNALALVGEGKKKEAAAVIENDLGMSAMGSHPGMMKANQELPENVRSIGMEMHKAASKLAKSIGSMKPGAIDKGLSEISGGCVSCHMAYRVR